jgi:hypothetical protein
VIADRHAGNAFAHRFNHAATFVTEDRREYAFRCMNMIKTRAAVAWAAGEPLKIEEVDLMPPQKGEVHR